jgi:NAD(P)-dependent dehydrogenase (short-subunit alcohol dehydrogenase family)
MAAARRWYNATMAGDARVILVTGSTDGIGKQTALELAQAGCRVIVHGRNRPRVEAALADLRAKVPTGDFDGVSFDLGSMAAVRAGAAAVAAKAPVLHVLLNNAGVYAAERVLTEDGIELTLAVCHVGHFLLTELLMPQLKAGAPARVVNVSSIAHTRGTIHLDDLSMARTFSGYGAYAQAKLANVMHARSLAQRHPARELAAYSLHPGVIGTKLLREGFGPVRGGTVEQGARMLVTLALAEPGDDGPGATGAIDAPSGGYFSDGVPTPPGANALDDTVAEALWQATARLAGLA